MDPDDIDDPKAGRPENRRAAVTEYLRQEIEHRQPGDLLPTISELLERFDLRSVQTVRMAYQPLIHDGLVTVPPKVRRYVVADPQSRPTEPQPSIQEVAVHLREAANQLTRAAAALEAIAATTPITRGGSA